jgi:hypothetical protein
VERQKDEGGTAMKKIAVATALMMALILGVSVKPASAGGKGNFWGGFAAGTATGLVFGTLAAPRYYAPAPVYYYPAPTYVYPAPVCRNLQTPGFWQQVPVTDQAGFTTYQSQWVPGSIQQVCQ